MLICFGSTPSLASFSRSTGSFSASCVTSCSLSRMLRGVLAGADSPFQKRKTALGYPASAIRPCYALGTSITPTLLIDGRNRAIGAVELASLGDQQARDLGVTADSRRIKRLR